MGDGFDGANYLFAGDVDRKADVTDADSSGGTITVTGDVTDDLVKTADIDETTEDTDTDTFETKNCSTLSNQEWTVSSVSYDSTADETTITVDESVSADSESDGNIEYTVFADMMYQTSVTVDDDVNIINANYKKKGHANKLYGKKDGSMSIDTLGIPPGKTSEVMDALRKAYDNENTILGRRREVNPDTGDVLVEEAPYLVANINTTGDDDTAVNKSITLQRDDTWSEISAP